MKTFWKSIFWFFGVSLPVALASIEMVFHLPYPLFGQITNLIAMFVYGSLFWAMI